MKRIVVTGGSGRLGQFVIRELLAHRYEVLSLDRVPPREKLCPSWLTDLRFGAADFACALEPIARRHGCEVGEVVIAWTLAQPGITFSLCGARNAAQAIENARAGEVRLSADELAAIDAAIVAHLGPVAAAG